MKIKNDPNLYIKKDEAGNIAMISLYVDDLIITCSAFKLIEEIKSQLCSGPVIIGNVTLQLLIWQCSPDEDIWLVGLS